MKANRNEAAVYHIRSYNRYTKSTASKFTHIGNRVKHLHDNERQKTLQNSFIASEKENESKMWFRFWLDFYTHLSKYVS